MMKKVLTLIFDNNKAKFISKGFCEAFRQLSFFVYEMKIYDLNINEINKIAPNIIFIFWSGKESENLVKDFFEKLSFSPYVIHCAQSNEYIPKVFKKIKSHYIFEGNSKTKKMTYVQGILASDYKADFTSYNHNITFAGNPAFYNRELILTELVKNFGEISIFCRVFDFHKSVEDIIQKKLLDNYQIELYRKSYKGCVNSAKLLADIYIASKINIDIPKYCEISEDNNSVINYRVREITASEGFLLAPYSETITKQYEDGKEIETYKDIYELIDKSEFYLKKTEISGIIALKGRKNTISNFSYYDRLKLMLEVIYGKDFSNR